MSTFIRKPASSPLTVNTDATQHYVVEKSEEAGIKDLRKLAAREAKEESWIYVEASGPNGTTTKLWYEIGENEQAGSTEFKYARLNDIQKDIQQRGMSLTRWRNYHFHPQHDKAHVNSETPSAPDLGSIVDTNQYRQRELAGTPRLDYGVVTMSGHWVFGLTQDPPAANTPEADRYNETRYNDLDMYKNARMRSRLLCLGGSCMISGLNDMKAIFEQSGWLTLQFTKASP